MSNIKFTMKDLDGTVMPYTSFVISTSTSANAASFTTNLNGQATVSLSAVSTPYYISKQDGTTESVIAYKFFVPDTTYTLDSELLFVDMGKISKDKNDKSIAALIEAKVVAVNAANRALQVVSLLGDVSTIRDNLDNLVQVASNIDNIDAVVTNETNINTVASNTTNINKVATIDTNITAVANSQTNVNTVASNITNVNTVAPHTASIGTVATNVGSVNTVSGSIASVNTTASNIANITTVAGNTPNISTVAGISPAVSTVANNIENIQTTAEGIGFIPGVLPYVSNITTVANNIDPIVAVGNNINNINEVRAMEADIEVLADEIANIAGAAAAVTQAVDAQKVLYVAGTDYIKNTSNTLVLPFFPAKSNSVKSFFDGEYKNKDTWNREGKNIVFTSVIDADKVEIQYEVPSSFVGLSPEDILVIQNAEAAAQASEADAQQSATAAAISASIAQGVANQAVDAIKQLFVAGTGFTKGVSTQLTMDFLPVKTNAVKVFFDGVYQNKNTFTRVGKIITFNEAINVDNVEIHYEVPSQFVGLDDDDTAMLVAAQNAAQASANAAAASFDSFDDRYLGAKSVAPTTDNDGNSLLVGAKYFNSTESKMYVRNSSNVWQLDTADSSAVNYLPAGTGAVITNVQDRLRAYESELIEGARPHVISRTGSSGEPNTILGRPELNKIASYATACHLQGGTVGLPNMIGWQYDYRRVQGAGSAVFVMTFAFVVNATSASPRITSIRRTDNVYTPISVASISGYGTNTLTITLTAALADTFDLFVQVDGNTELSQSDPTSNPRLSNILSGYNNRSTQLMNVVNGAHCRAVGSDGHNTILGGSNNLILGGAYQTIGGTNVIVGENDPAGTGVTAIGQNLVADGTGSVNIGFANTTSGNYTTAIGGQNKVTVGNSAAIGYSLTVSGGSSFACGNGNTLSGSSGFVSGLTNTVAGNYQLVGGRQHSITAGDYSLIAGYENTSALGYAFAIGNKAVIRNTGQTVRGYGGTTSGSRQFGNAFASGQSTSDAAVILSKTGGATITVGLDCAASIRGRIVGRDKNNVESCVFTVDALIMVNTAGVTTIVSGATNTLTHNSSGLAGVTSTLVAGTAGVQVRVVGLTGKTINWLTVLELVEIGVGAQ